MLYKQNIGKNHGLANKEPKLKINSNLISNIVCVRIAFIPNHNIIAVCPHIFSQFNHAAGQMTSQPQIVFA